jgi:hypothetical protein
LTILQILMKLLHLQRNGDWWTNRDHCYMSTLPCGVTNNNTTWGKWRVTYNNITWGKWRMTDLLMWSINHHFFANVIISSRFVGELLRQFKHEKKYTQTFREKFSSPNSKGHIAIYCLSLNFSHFNLLQNWWIQ